MQHQHTARTLAMIDQQYATASASVAKVCKRMRELVDEGHTKDEAWLCVSGFIDREVQQLAATGDTTSISMVVAAACRQLTWGDPWPPLLRDRH